MSRHAQPSDAPAAAADMRLDKWLWVARFFKTRGLAADEVEKGRVHVNGQAAKPARSVRVNDLHRDPPARLGP